MPAYKIRKAQASDAPDIAALHAANWREHYKGILPAEYLRNQVEADRRDHWASVLASKEPGSLIIVARNCGELAGFAAIFPGRDRQAEVTLDNLHVAAGARGGGLGRTLMAHAVKRLIGNGTKSLCLWAFDDNKPAVRFYERLGGKKTADGFDTMHGAHAAHTQFSWHDLNSLVEACES